MKGDVNSLSFYCYNSILYLSVPNVNLLYLVILDVYIVMPLVSFDWYLLDKTFCILLLWIFLYPLVSAEPFINRIYLNFASYYVPPLGQARALLSVPSTLKDIKTEASDILKVNVDFSLLLTPPGSCLHFISHPWVLLTNFAGHQCIKKISKYTLFYILNHF